MTPWAWLEDDLEMTGRELLHAIMAAPLLLATFGVICAFLYLMAPA